MADKVVQLKDKQGNNLYPVPAGGGDVLINPYIPGCILAMTRCDYANYSSAWDFDNAVQYSHGTWTQYGPMKQTSKKYALNIVVPQGEHWIIYVEYVLPKIYAPDTARWFTFGIAKYPEGTSEWDAANNKYYASSIQQYADGGGWSQATNGKVFVLEPGSHWFAVYIMTSGGNVTVYGGGVSEGSSLSTWNRGAAITLTAYLVERCTDQMYEERRAIYEQ